MNEEQRIKLLEEELKILKNEVKTILLDVREQYLNIQNPFNTSMVPNTQPAGASPEPKEISPETQAEEPNSMRDEGVPAAQPEKAMSPGASGRQYQEPLARAEAAPVAQLERAAAPALLGRQYQDPPGLPGPASMANEVQGPGSFAGPGPAEAGQYEGGAEDEDGYRQKARGPRARRKGSMAFDVDGDAGEDGGDGEGHDDVDSKMMFPKNGKKKVGGVQISGTRADLVVIAGLTQWVDQATGKLGKDRTEALVEMSTAMGRIPDNIKDVLIRMVRISRYESTNIQSPTATDYLATLAQLESLMGGEQVRDNALLSMLSMMKESSRG